MACGTPVVASNLRSLVEAVGEAAELVSPDNVFDIARGLREVLLRPERRGSADGRRAATRRSAFIGSHTAREVLPIYREVVTQYV